MGKKNPRLAKTLRDGARKSRVEADYCDSIGRPDWAKETRDEADALEKAARYHAGED